MILIKEIVVVQRRYNIVDHTGCCLFSCTGVSFMVVLANGTRGIRSEVTRERYGRRGIGSGVGDIGTFWCREGCLTYPLAGDEHTDERCTAERALCSVRWELFVYYSVLFLLLLLLLLCWKIVLRGIDGRGYVCLVRGLTFFRWHRLYNKLLTAGRWERTAPGFAPA